MNEILGLYRPGTSVFHRLPAGVKLAALAACGVVSFLLSMKPVFAGIFLVLVLIGYLGAGFSLRLAFLQVKPLAVILIFIFAMNTWARSWQIGLSVSLTIGALVMAAALVTLTTPTRSIVAVIVALCTPLRPFGVNPDRVGLLILMGIRCVPLIAGIAREIREAQIARGATTSISAFAAPLIVRALRDADQMADALVARGLDD